MSKYKKYELLPAERIEIRYDNKVVYKKARRIKALRDIPLHGVKAGDIGGYVTGPWGYKPIISHGGSSWVAGNAVLIGNVQINGDSLVKDNARLVCESTDSKIFISDNVIISGNAVLISQYKRNLSVLNSSEVSDDALVRCDYPAGLSSDKYTISHNAKILENATIFNSSVTDNAVVKGNSIVNEGSMIGDNAIVQDYAHLSKKCRVSGTAIIEGNRQLPPNSRINDNSTIAPSVDSSTFHESSTPDILRGTGSKYSKMFEDVKVSIDSYQKDIIKLLKYPTMSDLTDTHTLKMFTSLREVEYIDPIQEPDEYKTAVQNLSSAFMVAESHARKIHHSNLDNRAKDSIDTARKMFSIAANEASSETEKKNAFKQGFKKLEGVVSVPDVAVDEFRIKVGLPELEQL